MTEKIKRIVIQSALLGGILILTFGILYGLSIVGISFTEKEFIFLAEKVCEASTDIDSSKLTIEGLSDKIKRKYAFTTILSAQYSGKEAFLFFVPIPGKYGIYSAVFLYEPSKGCLFCGLAGTAFKHQPQYYGITDIKIKFYTKKIQMLIEKEGLSHEK